MAPTANPSESSPLTDKLGPLPLWVWGVAGLALAWYLIRRFAGGSGSATPISSLESPSTTPADATGGGGGAAGPDDTSTVLPVSSTAPDSTAAAVQAMDTTDATAPTAISTPLYSQPQTSATYTIGGYTLPVAGTTAGGNPAGPGPVVEPSTAGYVAPSVGVAAAGSGVGTASSSIGHGAVLTG
jgi:hypothetical protein